MTIHNFKRKCSLDNGVWLQCTKCGTTCHSGFFWLGGYKSIFEPPCFEYVNDDLLKAWITEAAAIDETKTI